MKLQLNLLNSQIKEKKYSKKKYLKKFKKINESLHSGNEEWTAWIDYPSKNISNLDNIKELANKITKESDVLIVLGIGGSYLGAYACLSAIKNKSKTKVVFSGINISNEELSNTFEKYKDKNVHVNVISKSGTTTETMIAFEYALNFLKEKYQDNYKDHLTITTDRQKGYLREFANKNDIASLEVPDNIGGRYSVLSAVGTLPLLCAGIDIDKLFQGACKAEQDLKISDENNIAYRYALTRYLLNRKGKKIELLSTFYPRLSNFGSWWTQLYAESEGKDKKGLFVTNLNFSTDLHSVGQFIQQGTPIVFETFLSVESVVNDREITNIDNNNPIKYLEGKTVEEVNLAAQKGTIEAHVSANVPTIQITLEKIDEEHLVYLFYFFELSCAISGKLLGVNPFNQPGVEDYKRNMKKYLSNQDSKTPTNKK